MGIKRGKYTNSIKKYPRNEYSRDELFLNSDPCVTIWLIFYDIVDNYSFN